MHVYVSGFRTAVDSLLSKAAKWYGDVIHEQLGDSSSTINKDATTFKCYFCNSVAGDDWCADKDGVEDKAVKVDCSGCAYFFSSKHYNNLH